MSPYRLKPRRRKSELAPSISAERVDQTLVESVYHSLLGGILSGKYPQGTILSEVAVARDFEISRTPVHDALRQLARDGLVTRERNRRARVAGITSDDVFEVFEMRK